MTQTLTDTVELPPPKEPATWQHIKHVICRGNLDDLYRDPVCELAYRAWSKPVKAQWGSLERFIRVERLHWDETHSSPSSAGNAFFEDIDDEWLVKMIPNHWPYNIPLKCRHWCVWSRKPITHIAQLPSAPDSPGGPVQHTPSTNGHGHVPAAAQANGRVAPSSPESLPSSSSYSSSSSSSSQSPSQPSAPNGSSSSSSSKLAHAPHARPVPWPFPHMSRKEQEDLYAAVSHDGIRALVLPDEDARGAAPEPVTGEYVLEFFRSRPHHAARLVAPSPSQHVAGTEPKTGAEAEAMAARAADATMAYFSQHCHSFVLKTFPPKQGWRSVLFCNPPHLRTVPGLDHWHIMSLAPDAPPSVE
ncbi:unnamed protein product [Tilletia controversa]|nr:unnamed protein product [Tilletia controversa]